MWDLMAVIAGFPRDLMDGDVLEFFLSFKE